MDAELHEQQAEPPQPLTIEDVANQLRRVQLEVIAPLVQQLQQVQAQQAHLQSSVQNAEAAATAAAGSSQAAAAAALAARGRGKSALAALTGDELTIEHDLQNPLQRPNTLADDDTRPQLFDLSLTAAGRIKANLGAGPGHEAATLVPALSFLFDGAAALDRVQQHLTPSSLPTPPQSRQ
jgi:hypothetical protein